MSNACSSNLPPIFILILFGSSYYIYVYYYCLSAVKNQQERKTFLILINIFAVMLLWSFFATMCSSGGEVPEEYKLSRNQHNSLIKASDDQKDNMLEQFCERHDLLLRTCTATGSIRYCLKCRHVKPDRTHHCSTCRQCFLRWDHHCPWINNCIGFRNYKSFLLLIFYTFTYCVYYVTSTMRHMIYEINNSKLNEDIPISVGFGFTTIMALVTCCFLCYHLYLTSNNETTLENIYPPHFADDDMTFDLGLKQNYIDVFGNRWYLWFLPVFSSMGTGDLFLVERK